MTGHEPVTPPTMATVTAKISSATATPCRRCSVLPQASTGGSMTRPPDPGGSRGRGFAATVRGSAGGHQLTGFSGLKSQMSKNVSRSCPDTSSYTAWKSAVVAVPSS